MTSSQSFRDGAEYAIDHARQLLAHLDSQLDLVRERVLHMPEPMHAQTTRERIEALSQPARWIFTAILEEMQNAEDIGGPEREQYLDLMTAIADEALERRECYREILAAEDEDPSADG